MGKLLSLKGFYSTSETVVVHVIRIALAVMWGIASITKLNSIDEFSASIESVFPSLANIVSPIALLVLITEGAVAVLMLTRLFTTAAWINVLMASMFLGINILRVTQGIHVPCSCFGLLFTASRVVMGTINLIMIMLGMLLINRLRP